MEDAFESFWETANSQENSPQQTNMHEHSVKIPQRLLNGIYRLLNKNVPIEHRLLNAQVPEQHCNVNVNMH